MSNDIELLYLKHNLDGLEKNHFNYLSSLKESGFEPNVIYDIGSCVLNWTNVAKKFWPNAEFILFEANPHCTFLYKDYKYYSGVLSNTSNKKIKFYLNETSPYGASYYREIGNKLSGKLYPVDRFLELDAMTLDDVVKKYNFPLPDLVKMDVQGAEYDVIQGGADTLKNAKHLIMELPKNNIQYNENAPPATQTISLAESMGWECVAPLFCENGAYDGDYGFINTRYL